MRKICIRSILLKLIFAVGIATAQPTPRPVDGDAALLFVADTQTPMWLESLVLKTDDNETARAAVFTAMAAEREAAAVFHLGDITGLGSSSSAWREMDTEFAKLRAARLPLYPIFGNHDYMLFAGKGKSNFLSAFPWCEPSWYQARVGAVAVLLLNSNFSRLSKEELARQQRWYESTLIALDADPSVTVVIVGAHHAPYTNSKVVSPDAEVRRRFVPAYIASRKAGLFISGHAHACEHFRMRGKDFLVSGGGGGLLQPLHTGEKQLYRDLFPIQSPRRWFHYTRCSIEGGRLVVRIRMPDRKLRSFATPYVFNVPLYSAGPVERRE